MTRWTRPVFVQFLNPEILRLYGHDIRGRNARSLLAHAVALSRYCLVLSEGRLVLPTTYLWEVPFIDNYLLKLSAARECGLLSFVGPTADVMDSGFLQKKRDEYTAPPGALENRR